MSAKLLDSLALLYVVTAIIEQANHVMMVTTLILMVVLKHVRQRQDGNVHIRVDSLIHVIQSVEMA